jgi:protein SCO1
MRGKQPSSPIPFLKKVQGWAGIRTLERWLTFTSPLNPLSMRWRGDLTPRVRFTPPLRAWREGRGVSRFSALLALLILLTLGLAACGGDSDSDSATPEPTLPGTVLEPPKVVGDFTLTGQDGAPFTLSDLRGKVVVLYFGYTSCPDVCPTTFGIYARTAALLGDEADSVRFVFISVDPARDTPERLAQYVTAFHPDFLAATGDDATLRTIARDFGVFFQRVDYDNDVNYLVDHTASSFIVGPEGNLRAVVPYGTPPDALARYLRMFVGG